MEDIGTIRSFYEANLSLAEPDPPFELFVPEAPVYARSRFLPPSQVANATVNNSLISNGCRIGEGAVIENSVIGLRTIVEPNVVIRDSIIMGCDFYENDEDAIAKNAAKMVIGEGSQIEGAIVDKNCRIGKGVRIINASKREETSLDHRQCVIRDGIPVVLKNATLEDHWDLENAVQ